MQKSDDHLLGRYFDCVKQSTHNFARLWRARYPEAAVATINSDESFERGPEYHGGHVLPYRASAYETFHDVTCRRPNMTTTNDCSRVVSKSGCPSPSHRVPCLRVCREGHKTRESTYTPGSIHHPPSPFQVQSNPASGQPDTRKSAAFYPCNTCCRWNELNHDTDYSCGSVQADAAAARTSSVNEVAYCLCYKMIDAVNLKRAATAEPYCLVDTGTEFRPW